MTRNEIAARLFLFSAVLFALVGGFAWGRGDVPLTPAQWIIRFEYPLVAVLNLAAALLNDRRRMPRARSIP